MGDWWFTADLHIDHINVLGYCYRPWIDIDHMRESLVDIWNEYVKRKDTVVVLGDFHWGRAEKRVLDFAARLNGAKIFVKGNHDSWMRRDKRYMYNKKIGGINVWGCHYPLASWPSGINLHGHCHGSLQEKKVNRFDVGIDTNKEYRPYNFEEVKQWINYDYLTRRQREGVE